MRFVAAVGVVTVTTYLILQTVAALEPSDMVLAAALLAAVGAVVGWFVPRRSTFVAAFLGVLLAVFIIVWDSLIDYGGGTNALIILAPLLYLPVFLGAAVGLLVDRRRRRAVERPTQPGDAADVEA